jgi:dual specificity phosphatase 12
MSQMETVLFLRPICSQNFLVHHQIQFQTPLEDHVDEYDARCVGTSELSILSSRCLLAVRQELATREHMLDHGQLGPATPADSPVGSRRPSGSTQAVSVPRCPAELAPRRPSRLSFSSKFGESLSMSSIEPTAVQSANPIHTLRSMSHTSMDSTSALDIEDESETESNTFPANSSFTEPDLSKEDVSIDAAHILGLQLSDAVVSAVTDGKVQPEAQSKGGGASLPVEHFIRPSELSLHLFANPTLAALRSANSPVSPSLVNSPPILLNAKCSGYFVEPVSPGSSIIPILIFGHSR